MNKYKTLLVERIAMRSAKSNRNHTDNHSRDISHRTSS